MFTNLALTATSDINTNTSIANVTWKDNSDNELYFILEHSTDDLNFTDINHPVAAAVTYQGKNLVPNTTYYYRIKAVGSDFTSTFTKVGTTGITSVGSIRGDLASCGVGLATLPTTRAFVPPFISVGSANGIAAYPNPTQGLTKITVGQRLLNASVRLLGLAGKVIAEKSGIAGYTFQMDMTAKPGGLYTIEIIQGGNIQQLKLVKP